MIGGVGGVMPGIEHGIDEQLLDSASITLKLLGASNVHNAQLIPSLYVLHFEYSQCFYEQLIYGHGAYLKPKVVLYTIGNIVQVIHGVFEGCVDFL